MIGERRTHALTEQEFTEQVAPLIGGLVRLPEHRRSRRLPAHARICRRHVLGQQPLRRRDISERSVYPVAHSLADLAAGKAAVTRILAKP